MIKKILNDSMRWYKEIKSVKDYDGRTLSNIKDNNFVVIGMRRLGKTQLLKEIANNYKAEEVLFIDIQNPIFSDIDFKKIDGKRYEFIMSIMKIIEEKSIKIVLLDEVQAFNGWSKFLKGMVDKYSKVRFIATGSDANSLKQSAEFGVGRFNIYFAGVYTIEEYLKENKDVNDYVTNHSYPQVDSPLTTTEKYSAIIEKQISISNISNLNVSNVLRSIALNPGHKMTINKLSNTVKSMSDSKVSSEQVEAALEFLINSELVISLLDSPTSVRTSKRNEYTLYPADWNSYKYYTSHEYGNLSKETIPKKGFVFENMIVSNVFSKLNTSFKRSKIFNKISEPDIDIIINEQGYEIKSFDYKKATVKEQIKISKKSKELKTIIVHAGKTFEDENIKCVNWVEFIEGL